MNGNEARQGQVFAVGAMVLLVAAVLLSGGVGWHANGNGARDADALAAIEAGVDHIGSAEFAERILAGGDGMLLVDVRPPDEFAAFHLPRALNMSVPEVTASHNAALLRQHELVVLYSNGPAHPGQAWLELHRAGIRNARVLDGGLEAFRERILTPASLRDGGDEATATAEAARMALVRAFFLSPSPVHGGSGWATDPEHLVQPTVVSPAWLQARLGTVAVLDTRASANDYASLHVPTAVHFPEEPLRVRHGDRPLLLAEPALLAAALGKAGLRDDSEVVIYAADKTQDATLVALALLRVGHRKLALLDGGLLAWAAQQRPLVAGTVEPVPATHGVLPGADDFTIDAAALHASMARGMHVLDVRPADSYTGAKSTEARPGHIPGSVNRPYPQDLARTAGGVWWRPRAELAADYAALGLDPREPVAVTCRTGHQASQSFFVLRWLLGYENVRWYNGSWTDWAERTELPAEVGPSPHAEAR